MLQKDNNIQENKKLFSIPLISHWYVILTLIFVLMRITNIINWSPLWILSPLWLPWIIVILLISIPYLLLGLIWSIEALIKYINKLKWKKSKNTGEKY